MEKLFSVPLILKEMYLRGSAVKTEDGINVVSGQSLTTDTYFGSFPCRVYAESTTVETVQACAKVQGIGKLQLMHYSEDADECVEETVFDSPDAFVTVAVSTDLSAHRDGILYLKLSGTVEVSGIWYEGETGQTWKKDVRIAVIICTYRREEYVLGNLRRLCRTIAADPLLQESLRVICVDNGATLTESTLANAIPAGQTECITLIRNRNYGGSGGYARGMLEAQGIGGFTHFWMMDDDIRFEPAIFRRAVAFLQYRRTDDIRLAAGMFSFEKPAIQQEATADFNGYTFISNASELDFRDRTSLLLNNVQSNERTYGGWWSLITPANQALPMPFFIKMDDVEYGLRQNREQPVGVSEKKAAQGETAADAKPQYVIMNGFGVWHEAFGKKGNAWAEYYTTRNTLILQSLYPEFPSDPVKMLGIRLLKALAYNEPKCMEAVLRGVTDYAAGPEAFSQAVMIYQGDNNRKYMHCMTLGLATFWQQSS